MRRVSYPDTMNSLIFVQLLVFISVVAASPVPKIQQIGDDYRPAEHLTPDDFKKGRELGDAYDAPPPLAENATDPTLDDIVDDYQSRTAIRWPRLWWDWARVPYEISWKFNNFARQVIARAISQFHRNTCIRFVPRTNEWDYVILAPGNGCSSRISRQGGAQWVSLGDACIRTGIIMHELMHAVGFIHEQNRPDRDNYVRINWNNIVHGYKHNFEMCGNRFCNTFGTPYDFGSLMHYGPYDFAKWRGTPVITPARQDMGQRAGFSNLDIFKLNTYYNCQSRSSRNQPEPNGRSVSCKNVNEQCKKYSSVGHCEESPEWMNAHCPQSCESCSDECVDINAMCSKWEKRGQCKEQPDYMKVYCPKSCKVCPEPTENLGSTEEERIRNTIQKILATLSRITVRSLIGG